MRAIDEVGTKKTLRFVYYVLYQLAYHFIIDHLLFFSHFRKLALIIVGAKIGKDAIIMDVKFFNWHHQGPNGLTIGKDCFIGDDCLLDLYDRITLNDQVTLAPRVTVLTHTNVGYKNHPLQKHFPKKSLPVHFGKGCAVGTGAIIMPGISIGNNSFIGAGSVVTRNVPKNCVYAGNPAKLLRKIKYEKHK